MAERPSLPTQTNLAASDGNAVTKSAAEFLLSPTGTLLGTASVGFERPRSAPPGYELVDELGRGGMGVVYLARHLPLNRDVALKVILAGSHSSPEQRLRFLQEAEAAARIHHPNVVQVFEIGTWDGQPFLALEYCPGGTLAERLSGTPLPPKDAAGLVETLARAIQAAHEKGVVHRDIKPANVLLSSEGQPKMSDFGLAKLTESGIGMTITGAVMGTPSYAAPEQAAGDGKLVGPLSDVYSLGAVLYECLTGRPPFRAASPAETLLQVLQQEPASLRAINPLVPLELETVTLKCLEKNPDKRYASAVSLADELRRWLDGRPVLARPIGVIGRGRKWVHRNPIVTGLSAAIVVASVSGAIATYVKYRDAVAERKVADAERGKAINALNELAREKTVTEDAYLRGLLRPINRTASDQYSSGEGAAFRELSQISDERLRLRFIELALSSVDGCEKLAARPLDVVDAVAGLNRQTGARVAKVVGSALRTESTSKQVALAASLLIALLPNGDVELDTLALTVLMEQFANEQDHPALQRDVLALTSLAARLGSAEASLLARTVTERAAQERNWSEALDLLPQTVVARLSREDAAAIASTVAKRIQSENDSDRVWVLSWMLAEFADRMESAQGLAVVRPVALHVAKQLIAYKDKGEPVGLAAAIGYLARWLSPAEAAPIAKAIVGRVLDTRGNSQGAFDWGISALLDRLEPMEASDIARPIVRALADRIINKPDPSPNALVHDYSTLADLARQLTAGECESIVRPVYLHRLGLLKQQKNESAGFLVWALSRLARRLGQPEVATAARLAADKINWDDGSDHWNDIDSLESLAQCLNTTDANEVARIRVLRLEKAQPNPVAFRSVALALAAVAVRMNSAEASELLLPLARAATMRLANEKDGAGTIQLAGSLAALGQVLDSSEAAKLANLISDRLCAEGDLNAFKPLPEALAERLQDADLLHLIKTYGRIRTLRLTVLAEFGRRANSERTRSAALFGGVLAVPTSASLEFESVWKFVEWAEKSRPELDLESRPSQSAGR
jgi:Protein kinase domain